MIQLIIPVSYGINCDISWNEDIDYDVSYSVSCNEDINRIEDIYYSEDRKL